jgi:hypothetical protein
MPSNKIKPLREEETLDPLQVTRVVDYILNTRKEKHFQGWSAEQIELAIVMGTYQGLFYVATIDNEIEGICLLNKQEPFKLHICELVTTRCGLLPHFLCKFLGLWPTIKYLTALRNGKSIQYKVSDLKRYLLKVKV